MPKDIDSFNGLVKKNLSDDFPEWYISLSFGKSHSKNYTQAVALAKMAPKYIEQTVDSNLLHQAIYSDKCDEYLSFIKLYELVQNWKSSFVAINGKLVDRKIVGGINYCYGDKCRSGNPDFCYGASQFTENPFGCHRLQVSQYNHPWWSFGEFDTKGIWHIDKKTILNRIKENSKPYYLCPSFLIENVMKAFNDLPKTVDPNINKNFIRQGNIITHVNMEKNKVVGEYTININLNENSNENSNNDKEYLTQNHKENNGCLGCFVVAIAILFLIFILILLFT
jgi:hypothetical protein